MKNFVNKTFIKIDAWWKPNVFNKSLRYKIMILWSGNKCPHYAYEKLHNSFLKYSLTLLLTTSDAHSRLMHSLHT